MLSDRNAAGRCRVDTSDKSGQANEPSGNIERTNSEFSLHSCRRHDCVNDPIAFIRNVLLIRADKRLSTHAVSYTWHPLAFPRLSIRPYRNAPSSTRLSALRVANDVSIEYFPFVSIAYLGTLKMRHTIQKAINPSIQIYHSNISPFPFTFVSGSSIFTSSFLFTAVREGCLLFPIR